MSILGVIGTGFGCGIVEPPTPPVLVSLTDGGDYESLIASVSGTGPVQLYYRVKGTSSWTTGQTRSGSGDITQSGLLPGWYEVYATIINVGPESAPSEVEAVYIASEGDSIITDPDDPFAQNLIDEANLYINAHGEPIIYRPKAGGSREIKAIVERLPAEGLSGTGRNAPQTTISVVNSDIVGISSEELDKGGDQIIIAPMLGQPRQLRRIPKIIKMDAGMITLEVR